jgi:hypothetical protein
VEGEQARPERPALDIRVAKTRCPYCHDEIAHGVEPLVCPQCHALHHAECLVEPGRCAACAAPYQGSKVVFSFPGRDPPTSRSALVASTVLHVIAAGVALGAAFLDHGPQAA